MNILRYLLGAIVAIPLLPLLYFQGKRVRASVPTLPEAQGTEGVAASDSVGRRKLNLIAIGESTIAGVGVATHAEGLTGTLAAELALYFDAEVQWKVYARSGYTAQRVGNKLIPKIEETNIDIILIGLGGNDAFTLNTPWKWRTHIRQLIEELHSKHPEAILVFANMPPIKEFPAFTSPIKFTIGNLVEILGEELKSLVREFDYVFYFCEKITISGWVKKFEVEGSVKDFFSDGVHPSKLTYQTWAKDIARNISVHEKIRSALTGVGVVE